MRSLPAFVRMLITWLVTATPLVSLTPGAIGATTEPAPLAVVCVASYDHLLRNLDTLGHLTDRGQLRQMAEGAVATFTRGRGLVGIDQSKPWGLAIDSRGTAWEGVLFVPVTDFSQVVETLRQVSPNGLPEVQPGVHEFESPQGKAFVTSRDGFAFFVQTNEQLSRLPNRPAELLEELAEQYDVAVRVNVQVLPSNLRSLAINQLNRGAKIGLRRLPRETNEQFAQRRRMTQMQLDRVVTLIDETTDVTVGWELDEENQSTLVDFCIAGIEGGKLATQTAGWKDTRSRFAGFLRPEASLTFHLASSLLEEDVQEGLQTLALLRGQALQSLPNEEAQQLFAEFWNVLEDTLKQGHVDAAGFLDVASGDMRFAAAMAITGGTRLENTFRKAVRQIQQPGTFAVDWNVDEVGGISLHKVAVRDNSGTRHEIVLGFGENTLYAAGFDGVEATTLISESLAKSQRKRSKNMFPFQLSLQPSDFILQGKKVRRAMPRLATAWRSAQGQDHFTVRVEPIPNGCRYRFGLDRAALQALGQLASQRGG